jgi:hypothetical protein
MASIKTQLEPHNRGGLRIWQMPEPGRKYVVGADTGGGSRQGDFGAACVVEGESCALVARWYEVCSPNLWGPRCAMLASFYNDAFLAFETMPSAHGNTAALESMRFGYRNLYRRQTTDRTTRKVTEILGWHTNSTTKPQMIDRVKRALDDGNDIPDEELLLQLRSRYRNERGQMDGPGHDDLIMAHAIALLVRDQSWTAGKMRQDIAEPTTYHDRYWEGQKKLWARKAVGTGKNKRPTPWGANPPWKKTTTP